MKNAASQALGFSESQVWKRPWVMVRDQHASRAWTVFVQGHSTENNNQIKEFATNMKPYEQDEQVAPTYQPTHDEHEMSYGLRESVCTDSACRHSENQTADASTAQQELTCCQSHLCLGGTSNIQIKHWKPNDVVDDVSGSIDMSRLMIEHRCPGTLVC